MSKFRETFSEDLGTYWLFKCPGCHCCHFVRFDEDGRKNHLGNSLPVWKWNNDPEKPTVEPSLLVRGTVTCHSYIREGRIEFLHDCTHELAGQTVEIPEWDS